MKSRLRGELERYRKLKFRFFDLLRSSTEVSRGDIRAFVSTETWVRERERLKAGDPELDVHIHSFAEALEEAEIAVRSGKLPRKLSYRRSEWMEEDEPLPREGGGDTLISLPIQEVNKWREGRYDLVSLFSGALGLDIGFLAAGFNLRLASDIDESSKETVEHNLPSVPFLLGDFLKIGPERVLEKAGLDRGEVDVLTGGPPCQPFSTAGKRGGLNDPRASPLKSFVGAVRAIEPRVFVMEEVTGLRSARLKHVPISERNRPLRPEEKKGSAFETVLKMLGSTGYNFTYSTLNAADYGSPQIRERLIFIGLKKGEPKLPPPSHSDKPQAKLDLEISPWNTFWEATADLPGETDEFIPFSSERETYMRLIPPGGHWRHLPGCLVKKAMGGGYGSGGGKMGYFRRLSWDYPSPTVVTSPAQKGTILGHPEEPRPLSVGEYKRVQGFPDDWELAGGVGKKYKLIGDAVPVHLSYAIARKVKELIERGE